MRTVRPASRARQGWLRRALLLLWLASFAIVAGCKSAEPNLEPRVVSPGAAQTQNSRPDLSRESAQPPLLLWRVQHAAAVMYLFGSVHVAQASAYPLDPRIEAAFAGSDTLVLELNLDAETRQRVAARMQEVATLAPGRELSQELSPETWQLLQRAVPAPEARAALSRFRPWFVALALTSQALEGLGFSAELGMDEHFRRRSEGVKPILSLETLEGQLGLFTALDGPKQDELLRQTLEEIPNYGELMSGAFRAWRAGDQQALDRLLLAPLRERDAKLFDKLFKERNLGMAARLVELLDTRGTYFVVVGAGHLVGDSSVVHLLAERGMVPSLL